MRARTGRGRRDAGARGRPSAAATATLGELTDVVVDPRTDRVTHLVVAAQAGYGLARIVPIGLAAPGAANNEAELTLRCTQEDFGRLEPVETFVFLALGEAPQGGEDFDVGIETAFGMPSGVDEFGGYAVASTGDVGVSYDRIPKGTREIRRASPVSRPTGIASGTSPGCSWAPRGASRTSCSSTATSGGAATSRSRSASSRRSRPTRSC